MIDKELYNKLEELAKLLDLTLIDAKKGDFRPQSMSYVTPLELIDRIIANKNKTIVNDLFDTEIRLGSLEDDVFDELLKCCDIDRDGKWPFPDWAYDYYDKSFEFKDVEIGWRPTFKQLEKCWQLGFDRCWICYIDNTELYYTQDMTEKYYNNVKLTQR